MISEFSWIPLLITLIPASLLVLWVFQGKEVNYNEIMDKKKYFEREKTEKAEKKSAHGGKTIRIGNKKTEKTFGFKHNYRWFRKDPKREYRRSKRS